MIIKKKAIEELSLNLNLIFTGIEQDWPVELADSERLIEFISYYQKTKLSQDKKFALMALIFASYDDYLNLQEDEINEFGNQIKILVDTDPALFKDLIKYWSVENESDPEMLFKITPFVRAINDLT